MRRASRSSRRARRAALAALLAAAAAACRPAPAPSANVLFVTLDTTRADHTSAYGYGRDTTPTLRALAAAGARFDTAYAAASSTAPSHATLFTGLSPPAHGLVKNGVALPDAAETLAERLAARGYQTAAVVSSFVMDRRFGLAQGFGLWDDALPREDATFRTRRWNEFELEGGFDRRADRTTDRAIAWLERERDPGRPFFLFVHYFDPHAPYVPPPPFDARFAGAARGGGSPGPRELVDPYDGELAFADAELGRLLERLRALGIEHDTLVAVTADHGEGLMQHGVAAHTVDVYEEAVRVPLLMRWPGRIPPGRVIEGPAAAVDVAPTLLALLGVGDGGAPAGARSLARALRGGEALPAAWPVFLHRRPYDTPVRVHGRRVFGELVAVRQGRWKWIEGTRDGTRELYDLAADPHETRNLARASAAQAHVLSEQVGRWRRAQGGVSAPAPELSREDRERLEALGYVE